MLLLYNMIGSPKVMRRGLGLLRAAERRGEVDAAYAATLEDRILILEGKPQPYGSQFDCDDDGGLSPLPIADREDVVAAEPNATYPESRFYPQAITST